MGKNEQNEPESEEKTPKERLLAANEIILDIMLELDCSLCDLGEGECSHTDYIEVSTFIKSMIAKLNRNQID